MDAPNKDELLTFYEELFQVKIHKNKRDLKKALVDFI